MGYRRLPRARSAAALLRRYLTRCSCLCQSNRAICIAPAGEVTAPIANASNDGTNQIGGLFDRAKVIRCPVRPRPPIEQGPS